MAADTNHAPTTTTTAPGLEELDRALGVWLSPVTRRSVVQCAARLASVDLANLRAGDLPRLAREVRRGVQMFVKPSELANCLEVLARFENPVVERPAERVVRVGSEADIAEVRRHARAMCTALGFSEIGQTKLTTAVSEVTRNIVMYAGSGEVALRPLAGARAGIEVVAQDNGPGIGDVAHVLSGKYRSRQGMGVGLRGTRALVDDFDVQTSPTGTTVTLRRYVS